MSPRCDPTETSLSQCHPYELPLITGVFWEDRGHRTAEQDDHHGAECISMVRYDCNSHPAQNFECVDHHSPSSPGFSQSVADNVREVSQSPILLYDSQEKLKAAMRRTLHLTAYVYMVRRPRNRRINGPKAQPALAIAMGQASRPVPRISPTMLRS